MRLPGGWIVAKASVDAVVDRLRASGMKSLDVAQFKEMFGLTRRLAIPLLEYLDGAKVTRRVGDRRRNLDWAPDAKCRTRHPHPFFSSLLARYCPIAFLSATICLMSSE